MLGRGLLCCGLVSDATLIYRKLQYENAKNEFQICDAERYCHAMILLELKARADEIKLAAGFDADGIGTRVLIESLLESRYYAGKHRN